MQPALSVTAKHLDLRRALLKPPVLTTILRHFTAEPNLASAHSDKSPQPPPEPSIETQILHQLKTTQTPSWPTNTSLHTLLFPTPTAHLPSASLLRISRLLKSSTLALTFFHFLRNTAPSPLERHVLSTVFQSVLEHATREHPISPDHISQLLTVAKQLDIPLTNNSVHLLIMYFSRNGDVRRALVLYNELSPRSKPLYVSKGLLDSLLRVDYIDDALQLLNKMLQQDVYNPPDKNIMDMVFGSFLRRNWRKGVVNEDLIVELVSKFGKHGVFPSTIWLTELIRKFSWSGSSGKAWEVMEGLMELGKVETASCNVLLSRLGKDRDYQKVNLLLKKMKETNIQPDVRTFAIFLNHLCKCWRVDEALEVFKKIKQGSDGICVKPDVVLYNTLIDGLCKVGRHEEGLGLMEEMKLDGSCMPNVVTYNCLIDGFCKAGELERALELFDQMIKEGIEPVVITLNSLVDGMCKNGRVNSAMKFFKSMEEKGLKGNAITYTSLINAFCYANNIEKALKLFDEMLDCGIYPDAVVYYTLISGLAQAGRLDDATFVASKMQETGFSLDVVTYNLLIAGFCRKNRLDKAVDILQEMEKAGINPDSITYNTLISYVSENKDFATARKILSQMIDKGLIPTVVTFGALIHAYCLAGNLDEAMKIFQEMGLSSKVPPNTVIYNTMIDSLCKNGKVELALSLMDDMKHKGVRPNTTTYNAMFKGLWEKNWLEKAYKFMDQMTEQALNPDYITMEILTSWLSEIGEIDKLKSFVQGDKVSAFIA